MWAEESRRGSLYARESVKLGAAQAVRLEASSVPGGFTELKAEEDGSQWWRKMGQGVGACRWVHKRRLKVSKQHSGFSSDPFISEPP